MRKILLFALLLSISVTSCGQNSKKETAEKQAEMMFENTEFSFGNIEFDSDGTHEFVFKNTGKVPLIIKNVSSSCGCTTPEWSKKPIKRRKKGKITVKYDTKRVGSFIKSITVYSNAKNSPVKLIIRGFVKPKKQN